MAPRKEKSLAGIRALKELSPEARASIESRCKWRTFAPRMEIVGYQDQSNDVCFIVSGQVRVIIYSLSGKAVTFRTMNAGDMFGELAAMDGQGRSATVEAVTQCLIAQLTPQVFRELIYTEPAVTKAVLQHLVGLVRSLSMRIYEFSTLAVQNRIHAELLRLARDGKPMGEGVLITNAPTHAELASRISTHREAVARELSRLQKLRILARHGKGGLLLADVERLARMVAHAAEE